MAATTILTDESSNDSWFLKVPRPRFINFFHESLMRSGHFANVDDEQLMEACAGVWESSAKVKIFQLYIDLFDQAKHPFQPFHSVFYNVARTYSVSTGHFGRLRSLDMDATYKKLLWLPVDADDLLELMTGRLTHTNPQNKDVLRVFGDGLYATDQPTVALDRWVQRGCPAQFLPRVVFLALCAVTYSNPVISRNVYPTWPKDKSFPAPCDCLLIQGAYGPSEVAEVRYANELFHLANGPIRLFRRHSISEHTWYKLAHPSQCRPVRIFEMQLKR